MSNQLSNEDISDFQSDVEEELHVHGLMRDAGASSMDNRNQGPV